MSAISKDTDINSFALLYDFLKYRCKRPSKHFTFVAYFLVIIMLVGGSGVWAPYILSVSIDIPPSSEILKISVGELYTLMVGLCATSTVDLLFSRDSERYVSMFAIACLVIVVGLAFFSFLVISHDNRNHLALLCSGLGYVLSLFLWWIANGDNANLLDHSPPDAATGGDPMATPAGDLRGFKV